MNRENAELNRCPWIDLSRPDYVEYHDREWGVPVHDDRHLLSHFGRVKTLAFQPTASAEVSEA
jgi:hypothetical protein